MKEKEVSKDLEEVIASIVIDHCKVEMLDMETWKEKLNNENDYILCSAKEIHDMLTEMCEGCANLVIRMVDYRKLKVGQKMLYITHDFDGDSIVAGVVTTVENDHAIMRGDGMDLWIGDWNSDCFYLVK